MPKLVDEYPYNEKPTKHAGNHLSGIEDYLSDFWNRRALVLSSARVGYYSALKFFGLKRSDHVLIPDFMCQAILNITNVSGFPVKRPDERTRAVLVFHQWGYPQKMQEVSAEARKRGLIIIEDCAHGFDSTYQGRKIGTFGKAAIYSFAKMFSTYLGGVLTSDSSDLIEFVEKDRQSKTGLHHGLFNVIASRIAKKSFEQRKGRFYLDAVYLKSIHFPNLSKKVLSFLPQSLLEFSQILKKRKENYLVLKNTLVKDYLPIDQDSEIDPNPMLIPVFLPVNKLVPVREKLMKNGILTEILHFDVNRNLFFPDYQKCLAVPCHQGLQKSHLSDIAEIINNA